jgi:hypothetical protein
MLQEPNNEQKLTYIYETLKEQESRRKRQMFYKFLKWLIIGWLAYLVITNPSVIMTPIMNTVKPMIMEQAKSIMEENKQSLMDQVKNLLPGEELVPVSQPTPTTTKKTTK